MANKRADEIFCRSCGETIKKEAEICPECGVRNEKASPSTGHQGDSRPSHTHDPSKYDTTVSDTWWYGVAGGTLLWVILFVIASSLPSASSPILGLVLLIVWIGLPVSAYFDMKYIRANGSWDPNTVLWTIGLAIWVVNVFTGAVYLYRRHEVLGEP